MERKIFSKKQNILSKKKLSKESLQLKHLAILAIFYGAKSTISGLFYKEFWIERERETAEVYKL